MDPHAIAVIVGSLRRDSLNRKFAEALIALAPATLAMQPLPIGDLPLYNPDLEVDEPLPWKTFRAAIVDCTGVLFVTPEYNRSMPAALKNALDVGSRPPARNVWGGKPCAILSASPGAIGGFGASNHLRQSLVALDMPTLQQPTAYIGGADRQILPDGSINERTREFLAKFMNAFAAWVDLIARR
jgi:chromate reductase